MPEFDTSQNSHAVAGPSPRMQTIPLSLVHEGTTAEVVKIRGSEDTKSHLSTLGFVKGAEVYIVSKNNFGDMIVTVKGSRIAIDRSISSHVLTSL